MYVIAGCKLLQCFYVYGCLAKVRPVKRRDPVPQGHSIAMETNRHDESEEDEEDIMIQLVCTMLRSSVCC